MAVVVVVEAVTVEAQVQEQVEAEVEAEVLFSTPSAGGLIRMHHDLM